MKKYNKKGNCVAGEAGVWECKECGVGNYCDVCHLHDMPRGECEECPLCPGCDYDAGED
jgi:hypothetical protein